MSFVAQIIGGFAIALWVVSIQNEKREKILLFHLIRKFIIKKVHK